MNKRLFLFLSLSALIYSVYVNFRMRDELARLKAREVKRQQALDNYLEAISGGKLWEWWG